MAEIFDRRGRGFLELLRVARDKGTRDGMLWLGLAMADFDHKTVRPHDLPKPFPADQPVVVFVNGLASKPHYLGSLAKHLQPDCLTVLPDFQSALNSFKHVRVQAVYLAEFLRALIASLGTQRVHLVGHSNGGSVSLEALRLLDSDPNSKEVFSAIQSVITLASPIYFPPEGLEYHLIYAPFLRRVPALAHLFSDEFFTLISAYHKKLGLCLVAQNDLIALPQMQWVPGRPMEEIAMAHTWTRAQEALLANWIRGAIFGVLDKLDKVGMD